MNRSEVERYMVAWCEVYGYPGGQLALSREGVLGIVNNDPTLEDLKKRQFGKHECLYNSGEEYPEHCTTCGVAVNDPRRKKRPEGTASWW